MKTSMLYRLIVIGLGTLLSSSLVLQAQPFKVENKAGIPTQIRIMTVGGILHSGEISATKRSYTFEGVPQAYSLRLNTARFPNAQWQEYTIAPGVRQVSLTLAPSRQGLKVTEAINGKKRNYILYGKPGVAPAVTPPPLPPRTTPAEPPPLPPRTPAPTVAPPPSRTPAAPTATPSFEEELKTAIGRERKFIEPTKQAALTPEKAEEFRTEVRNLGLNAIRKKILERSLKLRQGLTYDQRQRINAEMEILKDVQKEKEAN